MRLWFKSFIALIILDKTTKNGNQKMTKNDFDKLFTT